MLQINTFQRMHIWNKTCRKIVYEYYSLTVYFIANYNELIATSFYSNVTTNVSWKYLNNIKFRCKCKKRQKSKHTSMFLNIVTLANLCMILSSLCSIFHVATLP